MKITEVRVKLMDDGDDRLQAFCSITIDDAFVVRDLKIIDGSSGPFVAMPSRKLTAHCSQCRSKNHLRAVFCNQCGQKLPEAAARDQEGRAKLYADIAHPINAECREMIQQKVIEALREELSLAQQPGYVSRYDDFLDLSDEPTPTTKPVSTSTERNRTDAAAKPPEPHLSGAGPKRTAIQGDPHDDFGAGIL